MKKHPQLLIGIIAAIAVLVVVILSIVMMAAGGRKDTYDSHMELAQRYLDELQYEQAIAEYSIAIEIEPNNVEAYLALATLYIDLEDYESAINVLEQGIQQTASDELANYLEKVQGTYQTVQERTEVLVVEEIDEIAERQEESYPVLVLGDDIKTQFDNIIQLCENENYWEAADIIHSDEFFEIAEKYASQREFSYETHEGISYFANYTQLYIKTEYMDYHIYFEIRKPTEDRYENGTFVLLPESGLGIMICESYNSAPKEGEPESGKGYLICETADYDFNGAYSIYGERQYESSLYIFKQSGKLKNNFYDGIISVEEGYASSSSLDTYQYIYEDGLLIPQRVDEDGRVYLGYGTVENMDVFREQFSEPRGPNQAISGYSCFINKAPWE